MEEQNKLAYFEGKEIRKVRYDEQWYFSIVGVIEVLTDSPIPRTYWSKLKAKIKKESELNPNWVQLKMPSTNENHDVAVEGGQMAGKFRKETEAKGIEVVSKQNYLKSDKIEELPDNTNQV